MDTPTFAPPPPKSNVGKIIGVLLLIFVVIGVIAYFVFFSGTETDEQTTDDPTTDGPTTDDPTTDDPTGGPVVPDESEPVVPDEPEPAGKYLKDAGWKCVSLGNSAYQFPVRRNADSMDIECASTDGKNCMTEIKNCEEALANILDNEMKPLICGENHKQIYGTTGYAPGTWCSNANDALPGGKEDPPPVQPTPEKQTGVWKCLSVAPDATIPVRIDPASGRVQCMSMDGANCLWRADPAICPREQLPNANNPDVNPLSCTVADEANQEGWCHKALSLF